uniref:Ataxin 2 SM domain-containing protein n=1 Tax=Rhizophora mucronata TaxID=61149 RepID=A0A2P2MJ05_RHIMU
MCLIGHTVEVQLKNGSMYSGTCYTTNFEKEFAIILKMARLTKDVSYWGRKAESVSMAPSKTLIIPGKDVVQVIAKNVTVTMDGISSDLQHEKQQELMLDSFISQSRQIEAERELEPWVPDEDDPQCPELENIFDGPRNRLLQYTFLSPDPLVIVLLF